MLSSTSPLDTIHKVHDLVTSVEIYAFSAGEGGTKMASSYDLDDLGFGVYGIIGLARSHTLRACI